MASLREWFEASKQAFGLDPETRQAFRAFGIPIAGIAGVGAGIGAWYALSTVPSAIRFAAVGGAAVAAFVAAYIYIRLHF